MQNEWWVLFILIALLTLSMCQDEIDLRYIEKKVEFGETNVGFLYPDGYFTSSTSPCGSQRAASIIGYKQENERNENKIVLVELLRNINADDPEWHYLFFIDEGMNRLDNCEKMGAIFHDDFHDFIPYGIFSTIEYKKNDDSHVVNAENSEFIQIRYENDSDGSLKTLSFGFPNGNASTGSYNWPYLPTPYFDQLMSKKEEYSETSYVILRMLTAQALIIDILSYLKLSTPRELEAYNTIYSTQLNRNFPFTWAIYDFHLEKLINRFENLMADYETLTNHSLPNCENQDFWNNDSIDTMIFKENDVLNIFDCECTNESCISNALNYLMNDLFSVFQQDLIPSIPSLKIFINHTTPLPHQNIDLGVYTDDSFPINIPLMLKNTAKDNESIFPSMTLPLLKTSCKLTDAAGESIFTCSIVNSNKRIDLADGLSEERIIEIDYYSEDETSSETTMENQGTYGVEVEITCLGIKHSIQRHCLSFTVNPTDEIRPLEVDTPFSAISEATTFLTHNGDNSVVILAGGHSDGSPVENVWEIDPQNGFTATHDTDMVFPSYGHVVIKLDESNSLLCGGCTSDNGSGCADIKDSCLKYNASALPENRWIPTNIELPDELYSAKSVIIDDTVYIGAGISNSTSGIKGNRTIWRFDQDSISFEEIVSIPTNYDIGFVGGIMQRINYSICFGFGLDEDSQHVGQELVCYNLISGNFRTYDLSNELDETVAFPFAAEIDDSTFLMGGGYNPYQTMLKSSYQIYYNQHTQTIEAKRINNFPMEIGGIAYSSAIYLSNYYKVFTFGGRISANQVYEAEDSNMIYEIWR